MGGALLFSTVNAIQLWMQVKGLFEWLAERGIRIPPETAVMLPYLLTIAALAFTVSRVQQPAALNKPFERGEN
jgi:simple sugar transport system permease protein